MNTLFSCLALLVVLVCAKHQTVCLTLSLRTHCTEAVKLHPTIDSYLQRCCFRVSAICCRAELENHAMLPAATEVQRSGSMTAVQLCAVHGARWVLLYESSSMP